MAERAPAASTAQGDSEVREKATRQFRSWLYITERSSSSGGPKVPSTSRPPCLSLSVPSTPDITSQCSPWMGVFLIQQTALGSCCHQQGRQGWTSALVLVGAGATQWASVRMVPLSQGMEFPDRFGALEEQWIPALGLVGGSCKSPMGILL